MHRDDGARAVPAWSGKSEAWGQQEQWFEFENCRDAAENRVSCPVVEAIMYGA